MTKHISEERLALYAGRDLPARDAASIETHLRWCDKCQALLTEYRDAQKFLVSSVEDPGPEELRQLREGIARELTSARHRAPARWLWAAIAAAALALLFVSNWQRVPHPGHTREQATAQVIVPERIQDMPALPAPRLKIVALPKKRMRHEVGLRAVALLERADEPAFIKMTTPDPNVLILWQTTERIQ